LGEDGRQEWIKVDLSSLEQGLESTVNIEQCSLHIMLSIGGTNETLF
jgi:hypothetical protein